MGGCQVLSWVVVVVDRDLFLNGYGISHWRVVLEMDR